jgi:hypothetical protein
MPRVKTPACRFITDLIHLTSLARKGALMSAKQEDANLIMRLYELRREETMRQARDWFTTDFAPQSAQDLLAAIRGADNAKYRMVTTYWDMAAAFVNHGAIDEELFNDIHNEHIAVFAKIEPYLAEFRQLAGTPWYLTHLEQLVMRRPDAQERLATLRRFMQARKQRMNDE